MIISISISTNPDTVKQIACKYWPCVHGVLLKREAEDGNLLVGDGVEQSLDDSVSKSPTLIFIDIHHLRNESVH